MIGLPRTTSDLLLAPVVLAISERIESLSELSVAELAFEVALAGNCADFTPELRRMGVLATVCGDIDLHGWRMAWDGKDLRLSHRGRSVVLGVPPQFDDYIRTPRLRRSA